MSSYEIPLPIGIIDPVSGKHTRTINISEFTAKVKKDLGNKKNQANPSATKDTILKNCISSINGQIPTEATLKAMYSVDRDYAIFRIRKQSFGETINGSATCSSCGVKQVIPIDMSKDFSITGLPDPEITDLHKHLDDKLYRTFTVENKEFNFKVIFRHETGDDRAKAISASNDNDIEAQMRVMGLCILELTYGDKRLTGPISLSYIENLPAKLWDYVTVYWNANQPGIDMNVTILCEKCGSESRWEMDVVDFFSPEMAKTVSKQGQLTKLSG